MSTKTSIKRIALVAAAALTLGGFSAVSAQAATTNVTPSTTASVTAVTATVGTYEIVHIAANTADKYYTITTSGAGSVFYPAAASDSTTSLSASSASTELWYSGATPGASVFGSSKTLDFSISSAVAGTQTITVVGDSNTGVQTLTYTWGAAAAFSATNSTAYVSTNVVSAETATAVAVSAAATTSDATIVVAKGVALVGTIYVKILNNTGAGSAISTGSITAVVTGSGLVTGRTSNSAAMATAGTRSATSYPDASGYAAFKIYGDNTSGTGSIAISYTSAGGTTTALATKTVTFTGTTPAALKTTQSGYVATAATALGTADTTAGDGAITATLTDSNGYPVAGLTSTGSAVSAGWYLVSDNTACITTTAPGVSDGSVTTADGVHNLYGTYNLTVTAASGAASGCSANVTAHYYVSSTVDLAGTAHKFTVGGAKISSITLTTDAASYAPGDKVTASLTAKDSVGNPVADGYYGVFYDAATNNLSAGVTVTPLTLSASTTNIPFSITAGAAGADKTYYFQNGVVTSKFYAPYTNGTVTMSGTLAASNAATAPSKIASALYGTTLTGSFQVVTPDSGSSSLAYDAASAATDAANNAYEEAQNATQAASDALAAVKALAVQVKALIALVNKIKAKLKA